MAAIDVKNMFIEMFAENSRTAFRCTKNNVKVLGETKTHRLSFFSDKKNIHIDRRRNRPYPPEKRLMFNKKRKTEQ